MCIKVKCKVPELPTYINAKISLCTKSITIIVTINKFKMSKNESVFAGQQYAPKVCQFNDHKAVQWHTKIVKRHSVGSNGPSVDTNYSFTPCDFDQSHVRFHFVIPPTSLFSWQCFPWSLQAMPASGKAIFGDLWSQFNINQYMRAGQKVLAWLLFATFWGEKCYRPQQRFLVSVL